MKILHMISVSLVMAGALNWGLVGLFDFNIVTALFGSWMGFENLIYMLVGAAAVMEIFKHGKNCKICKKR